MAVGVAFAVGFFLQGGWDRALVSLVASTVGVLLLATSGYAAAMLR